MTDSSFDVAEFLNNLAGAGLEPVPEAPTKLPAVCGEAELVRLVPEGWPADEPVPARWAELAGGFPEGFFLAARRGRCLDPECAFGVAVQWKDCQGRPGGGRQERAEREQSGFLLYQDAEGGTVADFHAAGRHTFITNLGRAGVPLTTAQKLARHSTPALTANVYTHLGLTDRAAAIGALPLPVEQRPAEADKGRLRATGTEG